MKRTRSVATGILSVMALGLAVWFINPVREMPLEDDWFYSLMAKSLVETGRYQLHPYAAADPLFQILWGGLFSLLGGYSFTTLRISVFILSMIGLVAFYFLARENELDHEGAVLLTMALISSPLVLRFSLNFMTDVPMMVLLIAALLFYARAIKRHSRKNMFIGALAASAAVLTRQTGAAVVAGVAVVWFLDKKRMERKLFYSLGIILPAIAVAWQYGMIKSYPNFAAHRALYLQHLYQLNISKVLASVLYRIDAILHYLALFSLPLVLLAFFDILFSKKRSLFLTLFFPVGPCTILVAFVADKFGFDQRGLTESLMFGGIGASILMLLGALLFILDHRLKQRDPQRDSLPSERTDSALLVMLSLFVLVMTVAVTIRFGSFMPYGGFNFDLLRELTWIRGLVTFITIIGGVLFGRIFLLRYVDRVGWNRLPPEQKLIDYTALFSFLLLLPFWFFGDEYILPLLPFCLIVVGRSIKKWFARPLWRALYITGCIIVLGYSVIETRGIMESDEAMWKGGEFIRAKGFTPEHVYHVDETNTYRYWRLYYSHFFSQLLEESGYNSNPSPAMAEFTYNEPYTSKEIKWAQNARFWVTKSPDPATWVTSIIGPPVNDKWNVVNKIPYESFFLTRKYVYVMEKEKGK